MSLRNGANSPAWVTPAVPIYPIAAQFADSLENTPQVINGVTAIRVSTWGRLFINVPAGTTKLTLWLACNATAGFGGFDCSVPVYVDGTYTTEFQSTGNDLEPFTVTLDGSSHTVQVWNGYEILLTGTYIYAVQGTGITIGTAPIVTRALAFYGDSITVGGASSPPGQLSFFARIRSIYPGRVAQEAFGGRKFFDDTEAGGIGFQNVDLLVARLVALNAGAATREYWINIGVNDATSGIWGGNTAAQLAAMQPVYASFLDKLHAADPGAKICCQSILITGSENLSYPQFRAMEQTVATDPSRSGYITFVDGTALMTTGGLFDGFHPTNTGHQAIALGTGADAGSTSIKAVLGI